MELKDRAISLNAVINVMHEMWGDSGELLDAIKELPSVTPQFYPPCEDCNKKMNEIRKAYDKIQSAEPKAGQMIEPQHQKMGCEGCIHEKTGNNSTYPYSHCSRCYTDKYKTEITFTVKEVESMMQKCALKSVANVLNMIRAEIEHVKDNPLFGMVSNYTMLEVILEIIDKYKAESEG